VKFVITPGNTHDTQAATELLADIGPSPMVLGDKACDANWLRDDVAERGEWANIPPKTWRKSSICFSSADARSTSGIVQFSPQPQPVP
jgi:transposase